MQPFVKTIHPRGVLSFAPDGEPLAGTSKCRKRSDLQGSKARDREDAEG